VEAKIGVMQRLFALYFQFSRVLDQWTKVFVVGLLAVMFFNVMAQVFCNYILRSGLSWSEEFSRLLLAWGTFAGAALVTRRTLHIGLNVVIQLAPKRMESAIRLAGYLIVLLFLYGLTLWGWKLCFFGRSQTSTYLDISYFWFYLGVPIGSSLMIIQTIYLALCEIMVLCRKEEAVDELKKRG
jgi:TRAP-type C4-dicarboxylate transport system permease small subunit